MKKRLIAILVATVLILVGTTTLVAATALPTPNRFGDYLRTSHTTWQVVDNDPNGLNCRMGRYSYERIIDPRSIRWC